MRSFLSTVMAMSTLLIAGVFFAEVWASTGGTERTQQTAMTRMVAATGRKLFPASNSEHVAVIIENHTEARPYHEGVKEAQVIIEMIVEGGISRFAAILDYAKLPKTVGPVRSLRPYMFEAVMPYVSSVVHAGGSPEAFELASKYEEKVFDMNILTAEGAKAGMRRDDIPAPHNLYIKEGGIELVAPKRNLTAHWPPFKTGGRLTNKDGEAANTVNINFGSRFHNVEFSYDASQRKYGRVDGGTKSPASPANVIILNAPIVEIGELGRLTIPLLSGDGYLFRDGRVVPITWKKKAPDEPFELMLENGGIARVAKGQIWLMILPNLERVTWSETL